MTNVLPLDTWRTLMGFHPFHFWGLAGPKVPVTSACNTLTRQHAWQQAQAAGRTEIARAIEVAEGRLADYLGFSPVPRYVSTTLAWPTLSSRAFQRYGSQDAAGRWLDVALDEGYVQAIGTEKLTLIGSAGVVLSDQDGDGVTDTFTASIGTSITDPSQIAVYHTAANRLDGEPAGERWRMTPVTVSIANGTATIRGRSWLLVKPVLYEGVATTELDATLATNYATTLEVYQRTTDSSVQATLIYETPPYPWFCNAIPNGLGVNGTDPAATATALARVGLRDGLHGLVSAAEAVQNPDGSWGAVAWNTTSIRPPDRITIQYLAGVPLVAGQPDRFWQPVIARLAAAELAQHICACDEANKELHRWQFDLARTTGAADESYGAIDRMDLANPLGTRRGQVYAWNQITNRQQYRGFLPG